MRALVGLGCATAMMLAVLAAAPALPDPGRSPDHKLLPLAPWRPSVESRFEHALVAIGQPPSGVEYENGVLTAYVPPLVPAALAGLRRDAALAAARVSRSCRCDLRRYRIVVADAHLRPAVLAMGTIDR